MTLVLETDRPYAIGLVLSCLVLCIAVTLLEVTKSKMELEACNRSQQPHSTRNLTAWNQISSFNLSKKLN
jgi:hypothetical protein